jgi:hypothetical protein
MALSRAPLKRRAIPTTPFNRRIGQFAVVSMAKI